ncbi:MAG: SGNH/GDSL hydrolase family protein [Candidatus Acidiferrales bacterium]
MEAGYAYQSNASNHQWLYDADDDLQSHESEIITNNMAMFGSPTDVKTAKGPDEFRIAILGDSFCATTTSTVPWPTALERLFGADDDFKRTVGKSNIRVLNFGLDGTGLTQWPSVYRSRAANFDPDLVIVNFIGDDILRRFIYRDTLQFGDNDYGMFACTALPVDIGNPACRNGYAFIIDPAHEDYRQRADEIKRRIYMASLRQLPWYSLNPELLATISQGRLGFYPKLELTKRATAKSAGGTGSPSTLHFDTEDQGIRASAEAITELASVPHPILILHHPMVTECLAHKSDAIFQHFMQAAGNVHIVDMTVELPQGVSADEINKWYNVPYDIHPSSYGAQVYAENVAKQVRAVLSGKTQAKTK